MVRYPPAHKAEMRTRIVSAASKLLRTNGVAGAAVDKVMDAAGLTRGGFYAYFSSKDDLVSEALTSALDESRAILTHGAPHERGWKAVKPIVDAYLSEKHVDQPAIGCPLPTCSAEATRDVPAAKASIESGVLLLAAEIEERLPRTKDPGMDRALATAALLVGGVVLARAVKSPTLSKRIRDACKRLALGE